MSASDWQIIFRDAVPAVAGVVVYDKGTQDILGRYIVAKSMKLANGRFLTRQKYYAQRPAAIAYAKKILAGRAMLAGVAYTPGDGQKTWAFKPFNALPESCAASSGFTFPTAVEKGGAS